MIEILVVSLGAAVLAMNGSLTLGGEAMVTVGLFAAAAVRLLPSVGRIAQALGQLRLNTAGIETLRDDMRMFARHAGEREAAANPPGQFERDIRLADIRLSFPGASVPSLDRVSLTIRKGEAVAFVGPSGAGKTTLANVVTGLLAPDSGQILVDGRAVSLSNRDWQDRIGYIPQDSYLLDDTLRRNVAFGIPDAEIDDGRVMAALGLAQLDGLLARLPQGLETEIGERGLRISGGQRQRVAIARALYRDPEILVFDEATSALDMATEAEITQAVKSLSGARTVIVITHRVATVASLDTLHFLKDGRLVASGPFMRLWSDCEEFRRAVPEAVQDLAAPSVVAGGKGG
jgi:ATP-binding cassette subfamily C protein